MTKSNKLTTLAACAGVSMIATLGASAVSAATVSNSANFDLFCEFDDVAGACEDAATVNLTGFDTTLGTLTAVELSQTSSLGGFGGVTTGSVSLDSTEVTSLATLGGGGFNFMEDLVASFGLDRFKDTAADFALSLDSSAFGAEWFGSLSITYTYDEGTPSEVPLPASAGFLALGLLGLGAAGRRKARK